MNPGSGFGSGFGGQNSSSSPFGASPGFAPSTTSSQVFGSGGSVFQTASTAGGLGSTTSPGTGTFGASFMQGSAGFGQSSGGVFGMLGSTSSSFGSGSSAPGFGAGQVSTAGFGSGSSAPGFGAGQVSTAGFGSGGFTAPGPRGPPPAYGTASSTGSSSGGMPFGAGFGQTSTTGTSVFGAASKATTGAGQTPQFGFGTASTAGLGSGSTGTSGFGTGSTGTSGFGTGSTGTSGFGTGSTGTSGFGTGSTGTSGFGTGSTGTSGFGTGTTGASGFASGSTTSMSGLTGFGAGPTSTSSFVAGSVGTSGFSTGSSSTTGFGAGLASTARFNTGLTSTSGFGATGGVFGTSATTSGSSFSSPASQSSSVFGGASVFGAKTEGGSGKVGQTSAASTFVQGQGSLFGGQSGKAQGLGGGGSSVFGHPSTTPSTASLFRTRASGSGSITSGLGSAAAVSLPGSTTTSSSVASGLFGSISQTSSVFGGPGTALKASSLAGSAGGAASSGVPASGSGFGAKLSGVSSVFGGALTTSQQEVPSIFGGATKSSQQDGSSSSTFGGALKASEQQGSSSVFGSASQSRLQQGRVFGGTATMTEDATKPLDNRSMLFPAAASKPSISLGISGQPVAGQGPSGASSSVFGGNSTFGDTTTTQAASVFGGKSDAVKTEPTGSVFGGRHSSGGSQAGSAVFKAEKEKASSQTKQPNPFGIFAQSVKHENDGAEVKAEKSGTLGTGDSSPKSLKRGRLGRIPDTVGQSSSGLFGKQLERSSAGGGTKPSGLFGGKKESGGAFNLPTSPDRVQKIRPEQAAEDDRDGSSQPSASTSSTPEKVRLRRSSSVLEDISTKTWLSLKGVPANLNRGSVLRSHFKQFGRVKQVRCIPAKRQASIQFETHEAAAVAKQHGAVLSKKEKPLTIFWKVSTADKSPSAAEEGKSFTGSARRSSPPQDLQESSLFSSVPSSVLSELASMGGAESETRKKLERGAREKPRGFLRQRQQGQPQSETEKASTSSSRRKTPPPSAPSASSGSAVSSAKSVKGDAVTVSSLRKMVATTTMDKVNVLGARDKLIRQMLGRQTVGVSSKAFVGTCPDMCPEKERLYREEIRRLSIYEIIPGSSTLTGSTSQVDPHKAVKEYSRSSADQDEPLPHELRPLPVLTMTMNYLLVEIADRGEESNWAEWYDFLWNRTRSIRKEITQQQLLSREVVELMEKCVRFHVFCSERLCMEDMMVFDPKINDENLTKSLQTLKELYADMHNKHGIFCPCEAEFRAYMVLMNLNEGDTLREVQQLRPEVRDSPEMTFAVKMFSALNSNNYVRFFRLVTTASFLNGCILHRYFNQIRARGLHIILRAHTAGTKKVPFPLSEFVRLLAFEDDKDAKEFCAYYGLLTTGSDLLLDRSALVAPESSLPSWRAIGLVESKRMVSVGEVINGGKLEPVWLPEPECSFDRDGRFIGTLEGLTDVAGAEDKVKPFTMKTSSKPSTLLPSPLEQFEDAGAASYAEASAAPLQGQAAVARHQQLHASVKNEVVKMIARELFLEVIDESARTISESCVTFCQWAVALSGDIIDDIISSVMSDVSREVSMEVIEAETEHQRQAATAEKQDREKRVTADLVTSVIDTTIDSELRQLAQDEIEEAQVQAEEERQERCVTSLTNELLQGALTGMVLEVCDEVHQVDVVARLQLLADLQKAVELKRISHWFSFWRKALLVRTRQKRAMLHFPCAPPMQSAAHRLRDMFPDRPQQQPSLDAGKPSLLLNHSARVTLLSPLEAEQRSLTLTAHLSMASLLKSLQRACAWQPLKLGSILRAPLLQGLQGWPEELVTKFVATGLQWKLLVSLPGSIETEEDDDDDDDSDMMTEKATKHGSVVPVLGQWLCAKLTHGEASSPSRQSAADREEATSKKNVLSQYSVELACVPGTTSKLRLGVCVRQVPEFSSSSKKDRPVSAEQGQAVTMGTSGVMFLLPHADTADDTKWLASRLRLAKLLAAKPMLPPTPLVLLLPYTPHPSSPTLSSPSASLTKEVSERLGVAGLQEQGVVSSVAVVELPVKAELPPDVAVTSQVLQTQVTEAVKFLASSLPEPPDLCHQRLGDLVEDMLTEHFFTPVLQDLRLRQQNGKLHQPPNALIGLYNCVLDHMAMALTSPALQDISWPVPELQQVAAAGIGIPRTDWNSKELLADIYEVVANLRLPWFQYKDQSATDWGQACCDVWTFVSAVVKKRCDSSVSLTTRISHILARTCLQFENLCSLTQNEDLCSPTYINAPWTDIISACVDFRLKRLHNWKEGEEDVGGDLEVFYEEEDMVGFEPPASWIKALLDSEDTESSHMQDTLELAAKQHFANRTSAEDIDISTHTTFSSQEVDDDDDDEKTSASDVNSTTRAQLPNKTLLEAAQDFSQLSDSMRSAMETSQKLLLHVGEERCKAEAFEKYLESVLQEKAPLVDPFHQSTQLRVPRVMQSGPRQAASVLFQPAASPRGLLQTAGRTPRRLPASSRRNPRRLLQEVSEGAADENDGVSEAKRLCREGQRPLVSEDLNQLKDELQAQREASELYEKRLQSLLES